MTSRRIGALLALTLIWAVQPATLAQPSAASAPGTSRILGRIHAADRRTPLQGATVLAYHLSTEKLHRSAPTDANGKFEIVGIPYGYYDLAVDTADGLFPATQVINVPPAGKFSASYSLIPSTGGTSEGSRDFRGSDKEVVGLAQLDQHLGSGEFWKSPKGVAILAGAGGVALLALAGGDDGPASSPFEP